MIQRIQTIFLVLVLASIGAFLSLPIWVKIDPNTAESCRMKALYHEHTTSEGVITYEYMPYALVGILAGVVFLISLIELFKYKNRVLQIKLGMLNSLLVVAILGGMWWMFTLQENSIPTVSNTFGAGFFMPVFAMVFNRLAIYFIKKDENLVRSVDRIR